MGISSLQIESASGALDWAHPLVRDWFLQRFGSPTEPQVAGWPHIIAGRTTLISAPTGSGKTLAAFLACIDRLVRKALAGELRDETLVVYVSPLKALGNDIHKNLEEPLGEIQLLAGERGLLMPTIRSAVRTGDTTMRERRTMLKTPPHILVTTPESLYILLTAQRSREFLGKVETVIVDEIHAMADDKRGAHLALTLERLNHLVKQTSPRTKAPVRIGLSATQKPISLVADFLAGASESDQIKDFDGTAGTLDSQRASAVEVVEIASDRELDLAVETPATELGPVASSAMWDEIYDRIAALVNEHRSTLVFVNTRKLAERVAHKLAERIGSENVACHHGSLARRLRLEAENRLKQGRVRVLVATASLELGIDIGSVDLVCQIGSPRAIAVGLQRIGRAGHWRGAVPKGRIFATTRDELMECAALVRAIRSRELDALILPDTPLDILAQQIVAACGAEEWDEDELFALCRRAFPYLTLTREAYDKVLAMLSEGIAAKRGRYGAYLFHDRVNGRLRARRGARLAAITSGGAIPETALYAVVALPEGNIVGTLDEDFAVESNVGDIILLGTTSWRVRGVESRAGRVLVEDAHGAAPSVPFWRGEAPARTLELSSQISELRQAISERLPNTSAAMVEEAPSEQQQKHVVRGLVDSPEVDACRRWLMCECAVDAAGAEQMMSYVIEGRTVLGAVPTQQTIVAERFFDESGGMQLVIHSPFGGRINRAWGLALRKRFCRSFNFELQAAATDDGLNIALAEQHSFPLADVFQFLQPDTVEEVLQQAVLTGSPIFATRWRWDANRSLALLRFQGGKKVPPQIQRMRSDDLLASVFPDVAACFENIEGDLQVPDHPLVEEVMKDVLHEAMDIDGLKTLLEDIRAGKVRTVAIDTPVPSQFSHEILNANPYAYLDDAPLEERRARAVQMRRSLPASVLEEAGQLDPAAIALVCDEVRPDLRDADELHDLLQTLIVLPVPSHGLSSDTASHSWWGNLGTWQNLFESLVKERRAVLAQAAGSTFWVASEQTASFQSIYGDVSFDPTPPELQPRLGRDIASRQNAIERALLAWLQHTGPITTAEVSEQILKGVDEASIEVALLRLESTGAILRGSFRSGQAHEWCDRRLLARIHRLTVATLRRQIEPVAPADFMRWLCRWQHAAPGTQLSGDHGLLEVIRQLQGFESPANAWERHIFAARLRDYDRAALDQLCLSGAVGWGRLSPHRATLEFRDSEDAGRRVVPTSVAPITFFLREECDWIPLRHVQTVSELENSLSLSTRKIFDFLRQRGASFTTDLERALEVSRGEVEAGLWELVAAGLVTADGFDNLRALIDPRRRGSAGAIRVIGYSPRSLRARQTAGRWSLLHTDHGPETDQRQRNLESVCWMLLRRYGLVFRELLARESNLPRWRELQPAFRRLEDRGEIRGGRFVLGFTGEQFALPIAVESVRETARTKPIGEIITLSAADPLNLVGIIVPGDRVPAITSNVVAFRDGVAVQAGAAELVDEKAV